MKYLLMMFTLLLVSICYAQASNRDLSHSEAMKVNTFLRAYLNDPYYDYKSTRYIAVPASLEGHTRDVIVYFTDQRSCGSGGCTTLILAPDNASSYRVVTSITAAWRPIRILNTLSNGWRDIGVWVQGGGIRPGYEAILSYDGKSYPRNPTVAPAKKSKGDEGTIILDKTNVEVPLFE
ncbi:MAG: hypothetical protein WAM85_23410 [Terracidiphilus sp.]